MIQDNLKRPQKTKTLLERTEYCCYKISWGFCSTNHSEATPSTNIITSRNHTIAISITTHQKRICVAFVDKALLEKIGKFTKRFDLINIIHYKTFFYLLMKNVMKIKFIFYFQNLIQKLLEISKIRQKESKQDAGAKKRTADDGSGEEGAPFKSFYTFWNKLFSPSCRLVCEMVRFRMGHHPDNHR